MNRKEPRMSTIVWMEVVIAIAKAIAIAIAIAIP
jgi:hypothetical protein